MRQKDEPFQNAFARTTSLEVMTTRLSLSCATTKSPPKNKKSFFFPFLILSNMTHLCQSCRLCNHSGSSQPVAAAATSPSRSNTKGWQTEKSQCVPVCVCRIARARQGSTVWGLCSRRRKTVINCMPASCLHALLLPVQPPVPPARRWLTEKKHSATASFLLGGLKSVLLKAPKMLCVSN